MKLKSILYFLVLSYINCFSQTQNFISGKIVYTNLTLEKIDVVNLNSKKNCTTDAQGNFTIEAKINDVLYILSKDYYDIKLTLKKEDFTTERFIITLDKKPIELKDISLNKLEKVKFAVTPAEIAMAKLSKHESGSKVVGVYTGEMPYGVDFVGLFKRIFSGKKKEKETIPRFANFKEYVFSLYDINEFFHKKLEINEDELNLFLAYCESDTNYKTIMQNEDPLETMNYLIAKNNEFKKLER